MGHSTSRIGAVRLVLTAVMLIFLSALNGVRAQEPGKKGASWSCTSSLRLIPTV